MGGRMKSLGNFVKLPHKRDTPKNMALFGRCIFRHHSANGWTPSPFLLFQREFCQKIDFFSKKNQKDNTPSENKARSASKAVICTKLVTRKQMLL